MVTVRSGLQNEPAQEGARGCRMKRGMKLEVQGEEVGGGG